MTDEALVRLVGKRAKAFRKKQEMSQEDMMSHGFERRYYQRIEAGEVNLSLKTLNKLAKALNVTPARLLS